MFDWSTPFTHQWILCQYRYLSAHHCRSVFAFVNNHDQTTHDDWSINDHLAGSLDILDKKRDSIQFICSSLKNFCQYKICTKQIKFIRILMIHNLIILRRRTRQNLKFKNMAKSKIQMANHWQQDKRSCLRDWDKNGMKHNLHNYNAELQFNCH